MKYINNIPALLIGILFILSFVVSPQITQAQSAQNNCEVPNFSITSDDNVLAIAGEEFSYYVVTSSDEPYEIELSSELPANLNYSNNQITGIPTAQSVGDHTITFSVTNDCGTTVDSIKLSVFSADGSSSDTLAQAGDEEDSTDDAAAAGTVGLDEIPETGIVADTALTVGFYILALLLIAFISGTKLRFSIAGQREDLGNMSVIPSPERRYSDFMSRRKHSKIRDKQRRFGDGIRR